MTDYNPDADTVREALACGLSDADGELHYAFGWREPEDVTAALAALDRMVAVRDAAEWLLASRGHRGEQQAWRLLEAALAAPSATGGDS
jgi:hypothetical protein